MERISCLQLIVSEFNYIGYLRKTMNNIGIFFWILSYIIITGCHRHRISDPASIELEEIAKIPDNIEFCQIDSVSDGYFISYSRSFSKGGGCGLMKVTDNDTIMNTLLYESDKGTISSVDVEENNILFIRNDFSGRTLRTLLFFSHDSGHNWTIVSTPLGTIREFLKVGNSLYVEGSVDGTGKFFKSSDMGNSWVEINTLEKGLKSFYLLSKSSSESHLICIGSYSFNQRDNRILLFNTEKNSFKSVANLDDNAIYLKSNSRTSEVYAFLERNTVKIYSFENKFRLKSKISLPDYLADIGNVYINAELYLIAVSTRNPRNSEHEVWMSFDKGESWTLYEHNSSINLVSSSFGALFMNDEDGNVYRGYLKE